MGMYNLDAVHGDEYEMSLPVMDVMEIDSRVNEFFCCTPVDAPDILADKAVGDDEFKNILYSLASVDIKKNTETSREILLGAAVRLNQRCEQLTREMIENQEF